MNKICLRIMMFLGLMVFGCFFKGNFRVEASELEGIYLENKGEYDFIGTYQIGNGLICSIYGMEIPEESKLRMELQTKSYRKIYDIYDIEDTRVLQIWEQTTWRYGGNGNIGDGVATCTNASSAPCFIKNGVTNISKEESVDPGCYYCEYSFTYNGRRCTHTSITTCDVEGNIS